MIIALMALFVALNFIVLLIKYEKGRYSDLAVDIVILILIMSIFSGTNESRAIGTFASMIVSIYLYFKPPALPKDLL